MTNIVKHTDKRMYVYSGWGIAFDGKDEWSFGNEHPRNVIVNHLRLIASRMMF